MTVDDTGGVGGASVADFYIVPPSTILTVKQSTSRAI